MPASPTTPSLQTITLLNAIVAVAQAVQAASVEAQNILDQNAAVPILTIGDQMSTCALKSDGSLGAADSTPVQTNPINAPLYPGLLYALSAQQYGQLLNLLSAITCICAGAAVGSDGAAPAVLAAIVQVNP